MLCERKKEGAAQATAEEFQEETKNGEATVNDSTIRINVTGTKQTTMKPCPNHFRVQEDFLLFC
jgi:hypothetical protein